MRFPRTYLDMKIRRGGGPVSLVLMLAFALSGCAFGPSAWWKDDTWWARDGMTRAAPAPRGQRRESGPYQIIVRRGDTLYSLSRTHDVPLRALLDINNVRPPYQIQAGQRLLIPAAQYHVVRRGDTVYGISRSHGVDTTSLARLNRLRAPYTIAVGQKLQIPARGATPGKIQVATRASPSRTGTRAEARSGPRPAALPDPPRRKGGFSWPVEGKIVSGFGPKANGLHNDGVNISVPANTPVKAAQNGVVAYSGNELKGYGNLLLLRHSDGWMTAYAHNSKLLVKRGDRVTKGQIIARAGQTGNVSKPQVHFELRKGSKVVNPLSVL